MEYWPGSNQMGEILMELAFEFWGPPPALKKSENTDNTNEELLNTENDRENEEEGNQTTEEPEKTEEREREEGEIVTETATNEVEKPVLFKHPYSDRGGRSNSGLKQRSRSTVRKGYGPKVQKTKGAGERSPRTPSLKRQTSPVDSSKKAKQPKSTESKHANGPTKKS